jgi:hypothetical protein
VVGIHLCCHILHIPRIPLVGDRPRSSWPVWPRHVPSVQLSFPIKFTMYSYLYGSVIWRALSLLALLLAPAVRASTTCATGVHAIMARGQGPGDNLNVLVRIQDQILGQIPGSTSVGLPYDHNAADKYTAVHDGALMMQQYVRDYVASCPQSKIVVFGYSLVCGP